MTCASCPRNRPTLRRRFRPVGAPSSCTEDNQTVRYAYTDGLQTTITAHVPSRGKDQVTTYTYGTTKGAGAGDSKISTGHLLSEVEYPDSASASDVVTSAYDARGSRIYVKDQAGNVIDESYDASGRLTSRAVSTLASGFDGAVRRTETAYYAQGRSPESERPDGLVRKSYHSRLADERLVRLAFPHFVSGTGTFHGPASNAVSNLAGQSEATGSIAYSGGTTTTGIASHIDETDSDPITAVDVGTVARLSTSIYGDSGYRLDEARTYFDNEDDELGLLWYGNDSLPGLGRVLHDLFGAFWGN